MNAKIRWIALTLFSALLLYRSTFASELGFPYLISDPLRTTPGVVNTGAILPGDTTPFPRAAKKNFAQPLTLEEAVDLALSNNPRIKSAWADIKTQAAALGQAKALFLPVINTTVNWTGDNINYSDSRYSSSTTNKYNLQASLSWRIYDFGARSKNLLSSEDLLAVALASHDAALQEVLAGTILAYFDATSSSSSLTAKTKVEEIAQSTLNSAKTREAKGAISHLDTLRATTALAKASLERNRAEGNYHKSVAILKQALGLTNAPELFISTDLSEEQLGSAGKQDLALWIEEAQKKHPAIIAARKQLESAEKQIDVAKAVGLPTINFSANYYQNTRPGEAVTPSGARETTLIVGMSIPLFNGFASTYKVREAIAQVEKESATLADAEQRVALGVIKAHADTISSLNNLEASKNLIEAAQNALVVSQRKYDKGAADITEVLSTQTALTDAWDERLRCLAEWHSARLQLLANAGKMGRYAVTDLPAN